jgi:hypothetical protein
MMFLVPYRSQKMHDVSHEIQLHCKWHDFCMLDFSSISLEDNVVWIGRTLYVPGNKERVRKGQYAR